MPSAAAADPLREQRIAMFAAKGLVGCSPLAARRAKLELTRVSGDHERQRGGVVFQRE